MGTALTPSPGRPFPSGAPACKTQQGTPHPLWDWNIFLLKNPNNKEHHERGMSLTMQKMLDKHMQMQPSMQHLLSTADNRSALVHLPQQLIQLCVSLSLPK